MKKSIINLSLSALALLGASTAFAATVTMTVLPTAGFSAPGPVFYGPNLAFPSGHFAVNPGDYFTIRVSGTGFPDTGAGDLNLTFNSAAVEVRTPTLANGIVFSPGSPFTGGLLIADNPSFVSGNANGIQVGAGFVTTPTGAFDVIDIQFQALLAAPAGALANIIVSRRDPGWTDAVTFEEIPVNYVQALPVVVPVPAAAWLFVSALGGLATLRRILGRSLAA